MARIGLNLLHAFPEIGGGWNYMSNLISALASEDHSNEYVCFVTRASEVLVPARAGFRRVLIPFDARSRVRRLLIENSRLQRLARRERLDCMHWFANVQGVINAVPALVTVYDLQPFMDFGHLSMPKRTFLRWQLRRTARRAAMLLPMSQSTASGLSGMFGVAPSRLRVIPPVLEPIFTPPDAGTVRTVRDKYRLPDRFWLYVAHLYAHKNHSGLLTAYRDLKAADPTTWPLVLRGDPQPGGVDARALVERLGLQQDVIFLPRLAREELPGLYGAAAALVFPSLYEGAGIPVMEAQASGCPVIASDITAVREFAGDAAGYFDARRPEEILSRMRWLAGSPAERERMRAAGIERARAFTPAAVAAGLLGAYSAATGTSASGSRTQKRNSYGRA